MSNDIFSGEEMGGDQFLISAILVGGWIALLYDRDFPHRKIGLISGAVGTLLLITIFTLWPRYLQKPDSFPNPVAWQYWTVRNHLLTALVNAFAMIWLFRGYGFFSLAALIKGSKYLVIDEEELKTYPMKRWWAPALILFSINFLIALACLVKY